MRRCLDLNCRTACDCRKLHFWLNKHLQSSTLRTGSAADKHVSAAVLRL
jgi:hypothetical protein